MSRDKFLEAFAACNGAPQPSPLTESAKPVEREFILGQLTEAQAKQYDRLMPGDASDAQILTRIDELVKEYLDDLEHGVVVGENMSPRIIRSRLFKEFPGVDRKEIEWQIQRSLTRHQQVRDAGK